MEVEVGGVNRKVRVDVVARQETTRQQNEAKDPSVLSQILHSTSLLRHLQHIKKGIFSLD
jgi:hypothetical protein